jgi:Family of unknown function (DUF6505)
VAGVSGARNADLAYACEAHVLKLLRTIRLDPSDTLVFDRAAEPGEWAISGAFIFSSVDPETLSGKTRAAFRSGLLGVQSFGWSTLAQVVNVSETEYRIVIEMLVNQFLERLGAPDIASASTAAQEEVAFAASLCDHPANTLIAVQRVFEDGAIRESFRMIAPRADSEAMRVFSFVEVEGDEVQQPDEEVDLIELAKGKATRDER